ncbi:SAM-dependent methyltransferase [Arthrobacter sp. MYb211]|uniref:class I SAM-dependent methyltransferase n=1 Tax=unclassified Arthrobacter TaxID=235627 RepID=UPI000CFAC2A5|nr:MULTISPECIES: class I SAM-dependent methyltransferase [unclassified Arthrobacter]PRA13299.1 SAM-dependent methyltransferase [Arthrobacter sp. MYb221]PRC10496.1 SAM-dependent methyltransferase [Arthrobacter sp. MYb211]
MSKPVLDPASGSRMFYFDPADSRVLFGDIRSEEHVLCDGRALSITPDVYMDFRELPFPDESFRVVVFDPPHLVKAGPKSWQAAKYGRLNVETWREDLTAGFTECFRVLKPEGVLIFKWNETQIKVREILALTDQKPLIGHMSGKAMKTHWLTFMKGIAS